jgi:asparagine synthase (glutamine-hydrolysing)
MCGITGVYQVDGSPVSQETLAAMMGIIAHRGPDDQGSYVKDGIGLGMRRLSIIDLEGGRQPITNEDGKVVTVFNGEIYNYRELRSELSGRGHKFASASDTEVIVHLYEEFGDECVQRLRGMFAFAVWDNERRRLLIARDRLGIKPLYYTESRGRLIFASEIKAILQHPNIEARLDLQGLSGYLSLKYVPSPATMFRGIRSLPPGHTLVCDTYGTTTVRPYWDLSFAQNHTGKHSEAEYAEQLEALLKEAVRIHLVSDVPFGAFLSGGLDSSTIVALMSQLLGDPVKTFSVGFEGDGAAFSELPYARMVADCYGTDHHELIIEPRHLITLAEKVIWHLDQPIADDACIANFMVAELASRHVKMVLTGEGGDELFAGYARYSGERLSPLFRYARPTAKSLAIAASARIPGLRGPKLALYALCQADEAKRLANWFPLFNCDMKASLLNDEVKATLNGASAADGIFAEHLSRTDARDPLSRMLYVDTKLWLADDLLARGDKTSMAASLEARVPLLDHKLVEFAASLPPHLKIRRLTRKYLLKQVSRAWLPAKIVDRKKKGFPMPFSVWFRKEARSFVHDILSSDRVRRRGLFNPVFVERLLHQHDTGFADHGTLLWSLLSVELWHRLFIDSKFASRSLEPASAVAVSNGTERQAVQSL